MKRDQFEYIECACSSAEHTVRFYKDMDDDDYIVMEVCLADHQSLLKRLWVAIKYIAGYKSKYGMYDCTLIGHEQARKLIRLLKRVNGPKA